jgi:hypothetical protein
MSWAAVRLRWGQCVRGGVKALLLLLLLVVLVSGWTPREEKFWEMEEDHT